MSNGPDDLPAILGGGTERIQRLDIQDEMRNSYLTYAMSVIISRALPDARDGLKPSQRRILVAMNDLNLGPASSRVKCAKISGDTSGNYHPHGDGAIYPTLVRLAQNWIMREVLIDKQGNFGSLAGLPPAAMRYCVTGETLVRTLDGTRRIADLAEIEPDSECDLFLEVFNRDGQSVVASKLFHSGEHPTLRLRTREGFELTGTGNHPVLCLDHVGGVPTLRWRLLEQIAPGTRVAVARWHDGTTDKEDLSDRDRKLALLTGAFLAEGFLSERRAGFNNCDREFFGDVLDAYDDVVGGARYVSERTIRSGSRICELDVQNLRSLRSSPLAEMIGDRSSRKRIPSFIWHGSPAMKRVFLQALFEGDGSSSRLTRNTISISYSTRSRQLARELQVLLLEFGIVARQAHYGCGEVKVFISNRRDGRLFAQRVGFWGAKQRKLLAELAALPTASRSLSRDWIPYLADFIRRDCGSAWPDRDWLQRHNLDRIERWERDGNVIRSRIASEQVKGLIEPLTTAGYYFAEVESVTDAGVQPVYSIRVDSDCHSFITNGIVSHNTEARLSAASAELLRDLDRDTVDFVPSYDQRNTEPVVLPSRFPNLLVNGSSGIAVGMATSMPPHNLREVADAIILCIDQPECTIDDILEVLPGPDFPTGGVICGQMGIRQGYLTGRSTLTLRAKTHFEEERGRDVIVVTEIPYLETRDRIREKLEHLVRDERIKGISRITDLTDRNIPAWQVRLHIDLKKDADREIVLNQLFKYSPLQSTVSVIMLALVGNRPQTLDIKELIDEFIRHRTIVLRRRTEFLLSEARKRKHTVEGLLIAQIDIDQIISTIRQSSSRAEARDRLQQIAVPAELVARALGDDGFQAYQDEQGARDAYNLSARQAEAIVSMQLGSLANLEREQLSGEHRKLLDDIGEYLRLLSDEAHLRAVIRDDMLELKEKFPDKRRTDISDEELGDVDRADLITEEPMVVTLSQRGYVKRTPLSLYQAQHRGGRGIMGAKFDEEDPIEHLFVASTHDYLMFFTDRGRVYWQKVYDLPLQSRTSKGRALVNLLQLQDPDERVSSCLAVREFDEDRYLIMATRQGLVKKTVLSAYGRPLRGGLIAINLDEGDELIDVQIVSAGDDVILATTNGMSIRFAQEGARAMGRATRGVKGVKLGKGDAVIGMVVAEPERTLLTVCEKGYGKRTPIGAVAAEEGEAEPSDAEEPEIDTEPDDAAEAEPETGEDADEAAAGEGGNRRYRRQRRGGKGLRDIKTTARNGRVVDILSVSEEDEVLMITAGGKIQRIRAADVSQLGRNTQGVRIIRLDESDTLVSMARIPGEILEAAATAPPAELIDPRAAVPDPRALHADAEPETDLLDTDDEEPLT